MVKLELVGVGGGFFFFFFLFFSFNFIDLALGKNRPGCFVAKINLGYA